MTYSIIIQDHDNKLFQRMSHISGEREEHVTNNVAELQKIRNWLNMHSTQHNVDITYLINDGYSESESLYDSLVIEYNNQPGLTKLLKA